MEASRSGAACFIPIGPIRTLAPAAISNPVGGLCSSTLAMTEGSLRSFWLFAFPLPQVSGDWTDWSDQADLHH